MEIHAWVGIEISLCQQSEPAAPTSTHQRAHTHTHKLPMQEGMAGLETLFHCIPVSVLIIVVSLAIANILTIPVFLVSTYLVLIKCLYLLT